MQFKNLGLAKPILDAIDTLGYSQPSPIQEKAIPPVIEGRDVMAAAQTGTGKTAGFTLPILHRLASTERPNHAGNQARVLVLTPTRELAAQVAQNVKAYSQNLKVKSVVVFGGVSINPQMQKLRGGADVLIATPGRLLDLHNQKAIQFDKLEVLVLDEADRMLDMGFIHDIKRIIKLLPKKRQNLLFSATFSNEIRELARTIVHKPVEVSVTPPNSTVDAVTQSLIAVEKSDKTRILSRLIEDNDWFQVLVFSRTKHGANRLAKKLENQGIHSMAIHGNKSQGARTKALAEFKSGKLRVLVATDIAARGIDISQLPHVVNFDLPNVAEDYVHRIGRTGRAGATGEAVSLVSHDEFKQLVDIERFIKKLIPRVALDGYEPKNALPESTGDFRDKKIKKPKKAKPSEGNNRSRGDRSGGSQNKSRNANSRKRNEYSGRRRGDSRSDQSAQNSDCDQGGNKKSHGSAKAKAKNASSQRNSNRNNSSSENTVDKRRHKNPKANTSTSAKIDRSESNKSSEQQTASRGGRTAYSSNKKPRNKKKGGSRSGSNEPFIG